MAKFVLTYHGGSGEMPADPKEVEQVMAAWDSWFTSMGDALVEPGNPFGAHTAVHADGSIGDAPVPGMSGFTVVEAADAAAAAALAKGSPFLAQGSAVQISQCLEM